MRDIVMTKCKPENENVIAHNADWRGNRQTRAREVYHIMTGLYGMEAC
jgi:hypothetical protein